MSGAIKELSHKINVLKKTERIIHVTEISTLSKIGKLLKQAEIAVSYQQTVLKTLQQVRAGFSMLEDEQRSQPVVVFVTSNRGFCGAYNQNVFKQFDAYIANNPQTKVIVIGKYGYRYALKQNCEVIKFIDEPIEEVTLEKVAELTSEILYNLSIGIFDSIHCIFTQYIDALNNEVKSMKLYPYSSEELSATEYDVDNGVLDFEEDEELIEKLLIENYLCGLLYSILLYSVASEYSARRIAMKAAKDSVEEKLQESIQMKKKSTLHQKTNELFDIITSAGALEEES